MQIWINYLKTIAILAVVEIHVSAHYLGTYEVSSFSWWVSILANSEARFAVPLFVMISGALLLAPDKKLTIPNFYYRKLPRIILPLIFWSIFYIGYRIYSNELALIDIQNHVSMLLSGKSYYHMWYMYMFTSLIIFTPFIKKLLVSLTLREASILCAIIFTYEILTFFISKVLFNIKPLIVNEFLLFLGYYIAGYIFIKSAKVLHIRWRYLCGAIIVTPIFVAILYYYIQNYVHNWLNPAIIVMTFSMFIAARKLSSKLPDYKCINLTASHTMGIYLIHPIVIILLDKIYQFNNTSPIIFIPVAIIIVLAVSLVLSVAISKVAVFKRVV